MLTQIEMQYMESVKKIAREMGKPKDIDWEARRYETASRILQAIVANDYYDSRKAEAVKNAVEYADALCKALRGKQS